MLAQRNRSRQSQIRSLETKTRWFRPIKIRLLQYQGSRRRASRPTTHPRICRKIKTVQKTRILILNTLFYINSFVFFFYLIVWIFVWEKGGSLESKRDLLFKLYKRNEWVKCKRNRKIKYYWDQTIEFVLWKENFNFSHWNLYTQHFGSNFLHGYYYF